jgi:hypothetical protein
MTKERRKPQENPVAAFVVLPFFAVDKGLCQDFTNPGEDWGHDL